MSLPFHICLLQVQKFKISVLILICLCFVEMFLRKICSGKHGAKQHFIYACFILEMWTLPIDLKLIGGEIVSAAVR